MSYQQTKSFQIAKNSLTLKTIIIGISCHQGSSKKKICLNLTLFNSHLTDGDNTAIKGGKILRFDKGYITVLDNW